MPAADLIDAPRRSQPQPQPAKKKKEEPTQQRSKLGPSI